MQPEGTTLGIFLAMAVSAPGFAQAAMTKIGFLSPAIAPTHAAPNAALEAFRQGLADLGYVDGGTSPSRRGGGRDETINSPFSRPNLSVKRWTSWSESEGWPVVLQRARRRPYR